MAAQTNGHLRPGLIFLSHASGDKPLVERVLANSPQSHIFYDIKSIDPGSVNLESMEDAVLSSDVFVLFLSAESRRSRWVGFETTLARVQSIKRTNFRIIVVPIGGATYSDAPAWMQAYFTTLPQYTAKDIARTIKAALVDVLESSGTLRSALFVGRESLCNAIQVEILTRLARTSTNVNFVVFAGIEQMGRGTLATNLIPRIFPGSRRTGPTLDLPPFGDSLDLFLALRAQIDDQISTDTLRELMALFTAMPPQKQAETLLSNLKHFGSINQVVTVRSAFGLRQRTTRPKEWVLHLMDAMRQEPTVNLVWITDRLLPPEQLVDQPNVAQFSVPELDEQSIFLILATLLGAGSSSATALQKLARQIAGHVGTAHHVASLIETGQRTPETIHGIILSFQETVTRTLMDDMLTRQEYRNVLLVLSLFPYCEYDLLRTSPGIDEDVLRDVLLILGDSCVITFSLNRGYKVPEVIRNAIRRQQISLDSQVIKSIKDFLRDRVLNGSATIEQVDALLFMYGTFEDRIPDEFLDLLLPSALQEIVASQRVRAFSLAREDARPAFEIAAKLSLLAMSIPMADETCEQILYDGADSLVRCGGDPMPIVEFMRDRHMTSAHLVLGSYYLYRKRDLPAAEQELRIAFRSNERRQRSARMLARVLRSQGRGRAKEALEVLESVGDYRINRDSLLLREKINCLRALGREAEATQAVDRLEALDDVFGDFHAFRAGQYLNEGRLTEAARHVRLAGEKPRSNKVQLSLLDIAIRIEMDDFSKVDEVCAFVSSLGMHDDARQVRARAAIKQGLWHKAETELTAISKKTYFDFVVLAKALELKLDDFEIQADPAVFEKTEAELVRVQGEIEHRQFTLDRL